MKIRKEALKQIIKEEYDRMVDEAWGSQRSGKWSGYRTNPQTGEREQWVREPEGGGYWMPVNAPKEKPVSPRRKEFDAAWSPYEKQRAPYGSPKEARRIEIMYDPKFGITKMQSPYQRWARGEEVSEEEWQAQLQFLRDQIKTLEDLSPEVEEKDL